MAEPAWSGSQLDAPHAVADKAQRVQSMFSAIAPSYDLNNRVHSFGRDQAWRRAAVRMAELSAGDAVLDVACGTGDLAMAFAAGDRQKSAEGGRELVRPGRVLGVDFTHDMLVLADKKRPAAEEATGVPISYVAGDAKRLPLPDASVDVVSIAFGIRNVDQPELALAEFHRVLRPGGRVVILEFSLPRNAIVRAGYNLYFKHIMPRTASWIARDRSGAYRYLPKSVNTYISRERMVEMLGEAGFDAITHRVLTMGIAVIYRGVKAR